MYNKNILALGADIKNRVLFAQGKKFNFGQDIGDLSQAKNFTIFKRQIDRLTKEAKPDIIACDLHPEYFSTKFAKELNCQLSTVNCQLIQHHHAHIASVMQEYNLNKPVIGVSFDGTGYGQDGNFWGGEFLYLDKAEFKRLVHLKYRKMPGGERVVFEPWRMVLSILGSKAAPLLKSVKKDDQGLVLAMIQKGINSPLSSSAGRLFDAAAALLGICTHASFEAQGPIQLERIANRDVTDCYEFDIDKGIVDTDGIFLGMLSDIRKGKTKSAIAAKFHNSIAEIITQVVKKFSRRLSIKDVALSGGVFQSRFLSTRLIPKLDSLGLNVFINQRMPVNDLNISLGQFYVSCRTSKN